MTTRSKIFIIGSLLALTVAGLFASGTPAGTVIQSRSRVTFASRSGAYVDTAYSAVLTITIAQKGAINITPVTNAVSTASDSTNADYAVNVINSGNGSDAVKLSAVSSRGWTTQIFRDANADGILQPNEIASGTIAQTLSMIADAQSAVIIRVKVPRNESLNGAKDTTAFLARSNFDTAQTNTGKYITTVRTTGLDPVNPGLTVNDPSPASGQQVIYSFTITNNGTVSANNVNISNLFPAGLSFVSGSTSIGSVNGTSNPVLWTIGTLAPAQSVTVTVTFLVNNGILPGTILSNSFGVTYTSGANNYALQSNSVPVTVTGVLEYGIQIVPFTTSSVKELADTVTYRFKIRNSGSFKDVIELAHTSSQNIAWKFFRDGNNNSVWDKSDPLLVNTNDSAGVDLDSVAVGDSVRVFALSVIPKKDEDQLKDSLRVTAASAGDHSKSVNTVVVTTLNVPVIALEKTAFPAGNQPAGSVINYLITYRNTGSVSVSGFSVVDTTPDATKYVQNSVKVNGISESDNNGNVQVTSDQSNNSVITVSVGTLSARSSGTVEFKVKIK
ncbi:MAG: DUF11 domain-containing protein [Bacteroidota bacterium]